MKYYVLSDSHSRSFAYNDLFIPLFIGPGKTNLFLTEKQFEDTFNKIKKISSKLKPQSSLIFALSEPNLRFYLEDASNFKENGDEICELIIKRQLIVLKYLQSVGFKVFWLEAIPRKDINYSKLAIIYNNILEKKADSNSINIIKHFEETTYENNTIKESYIGDFIHCNHKLGDLIAGMLENGSSSFYWTYFHKIQVGQHEISIWGDFPKEQLIMHEKKPRNWSAFQKLTKSSELAVLIINRILKRMNIKKAKIVNAKEGWVLNQLVLDEFILEEPSIRYKKFYQYINFNNKKINFNDKNAKLILDLDPNSSTNYSNDYISLNRKNGFFLTKNFYLEINIDMSWFNKIFLKIELNSFLLAIFLKNKLKEMYIKILSISRL